MASAGAHVQIEDAQIPVGRAAPRIVGDRLGEVATRVEESLLVVGDEARQHEHLLGGAHPLRNRRVRSGGIELLTLIVIPRAVVVRRRHVSTPERDDAFGGSNAFVVALQIAEGYRAAQ